VKRVGEKLALLFIVGAVLLNFPVLAIFNHAATVAGVPVLYVYLFGAWLAVIAAGFVLARSRWPDEE
jgi:hypothetical protein